MSFHCVSNATAITYYILFISKNKIYFLIFNSIIDNTSIAAKLSKRAPGTRIQIVKGVISGLFLVSQEGFGRVLIFLGFLRNIVEKIHV